MWVTAEDFFRADHAEIWTAILVIRDSGKPVDCVTLADYLMTRGRFDVLGGNAMLTELIESVPGHGANAKYYAGIVREKSVARQLLDAASDTIREIYSHQFTAPELIDKVEERVFAITDRAVVGTTISAKELTDETWSNLQALKERRVIGLRTGFFDLDDMIGGLRPGQLIILAARPSVGKSALALNIASSVASEGNGVLFVSLEMSRSELGNRLVSAYGQVDGASLQRPWFLTDEAWGKIGDACNRVSVFPLWVDDTPARTVGHIAANARRIKHRSPNGLGLVVADYLALINGQRLKNENRQEEVARISKRMKQLARDLKVPVLCVHQLNRQIENRDDRRPRMADLRESGQIEQDADIILLLHRPDLIKPDDRPGEADLIVEKNRNGATGDVRLVFVKELTRFDSIALNPIATPPEDGGPPPF